VLNKIKQLKTKTMSNFKERLIQEQKDLQEKIEKLTVFQVSETFKSLPKEDRDLLNIQLYAMATYNTILLARIDRLKD
jgi:hypothetical protein